ncbi:phosphate/phosphite/phosphonate ABC transporter substrate-binding protein [Frigoriglobus tundricola]|uniref:Solute-binding protein family 3/N-terminal domain-containing protein n=1 Tax=Frigoriglobus tundricola TaxID=2774151 RepID=A0A6M5Z383_9BACT|nr:PhnD/SsuA/transferrin family substrate-binding protein [Frigoriglobus tundricola]QJW99953.1 hypothetical protein FTUN_7576 [Frigoriglobus tundricola]
MGRVCVLLVAAIVPVAVALVPSPRSPAAEPVVVRIGMPENMFSGMPPAVVQAASRPFQIMFEKQTGLKGEVVSAKDYADMADRLRAGTLEIAVFHGFEFAWVRQHPELVPLLVTVPGSKIHACLVVNAGSKAKGAQDLKGACIAVPANTKPHCQLYLDRLREKLPEGTCGTTKADGKSVEEALDAVCVGTCPAALVDFSAFVAYRDNKPGAGAQLTVLEKSDPFPSAVVVYRKEALDDKTAAKVRDGLIKCTDTAQGKLLTSLWRLKGFAELTAAYQTELEKSLKAYPAPKK